MLTDRMFKRTTSRTFFVPPGWRPYGPEGQDSARGRISLWLSQARKEKYSSIFSELGDLCAFARVVVYPIP